MSKIWKNFWDWYERNYLLNLSIATILFVLQFIHLFWLGGEVIAERLTGTPLFTLHGIWHWIIVLVDYTEIPALIGISLVYINDLRKGFAFKPLLYLIFINVQWLHLFWITDESVVNTFDAQMTILPFWLAWVAIAIDYLEVPVIFATFRKLYKALQKRDKNALKEAFDD